MANPRHHATTLHEPRADDTRLIPMPPNWPARYNGCTEPCDMLRGPCACGAYHHLNEPWVTDVLLLLQCRPKERRDG